MKTTILAAVLTFSMMSCSKNPNNPGNGGGGNTSGNLRPFTIEEQYFAQPFTHSLTKVQDTVRIFRVPEPKFELLQQDTTIPFPTLTGRASKYYPNGQAAAFHAGAWSYNQMDSTIEVYALNAPQLIGKVTERFNDSFYVVEYPSLGQIKVCVFE